MSKRIRLDVTRMFEDAVGEDYGVRPEAVDQAWEKVEAALQGLEARRQAGELPFYDLPDDEDVIKRIEDFAEKQKGKFRNIVVLGIGGSALGPIALRDSLKSLHWNARSDEHRDAPRLFVPDNPDPEYLGAVMDICDPSETLYNVVTKSGSTAETIAAFSAILGPLKDAVGDKFRNHLVFTTDPAKGALRQIAREEGITSFSIPPSVGGRFSVLTPVGLLPAALIGIDIRTVLEGAAAVREGVFSRKFDTNPSAAFALLQYLAHVEQGLHMHVVMPYSNALFRTADWFRQIWAESLGKKQDLKGKTVHTGPTPLAALGSTDQHSQVQLFVEGPFDKTFTFIIPESFRRKVTVSKHFPEIDTFDYLAGEDIGTLLRAEALATQRALTAAHRPNMAIHLDEIAPDTVGGLLYLFEAATLVAGSLYEVNPLDQPGVEAGKVATYALMGRPGYEDVRADIERERNREAWIIF
jgi:glucose-6-phosphate isomerase